MLRSVELQSISGQVRQELTLTITALEEAAYFNMDRYEEQMAHVFGAVSILKSNLARVEELDRALGECHCSIEGEGVAR